MRQVAHIDFRVPMMPPGMDRHQSNGFLLLRADHGESERVMKYGVGQPVRRFEDKRLLTGKGHYQDDLTLPRQLWAVFVRSPHAHARIVSIDTAASAGAPGVAAVFTGQDFANDGISSKGRNGAEKRDGSPMFAPQRPAMVIDRTRYVGDTVAMVIAETLARAKDAAELVQIEYEALPSVTSLAEAALADAPRVWDKNPDNISHTLERGDRAATEAAFVNASHIVRRRYVITRCRRNTWNRAAPSDLRRRRRTLHAVCRRELSASCPDMLAHMVFNVPESNVRVQVRDVGGGFGAKGWQYVDHRLTLWAAKKLGRPVKWKCERSKVLLADEHGRTISERSNSRWIAPESSSAFACTCWPASAPTSRPIGSC